MATQHVAVVTGGNRGIGREIARQLALQGMQVILTARDEAKGRAAADELRTGGLAIDAHPLDVTEAQSVEEFAAFLEATIGRCDVLINNAGIMMDDLQGDALTLDVHVLRNTLETNTIAPLRVAQAILPLMQRHGYGRVVNISSTLGQLHSMGGVYPAYSISKAALNAVTRTLSAAVQGSNILVNSMCPGWVRTDMGGPNAVRSVEEGADTAVFLATLPDGGPSGQFFQDRSVIPW
ncbi:MAG: SDR family oxidoreductase [Candidatus Hydrogenedentes bacterium]|nr:SDR family oxidoreductase [Candidatus Hydrogenedentota bacterium]